MLNRMTPVQIHLVKLERWLVKRMFLGTKVAEPVEFLPNSVYSSFPPSLHPSVLPSPSLRNTLVCVMCMSTSISWRLLTNKQKPKPPPDWMGFVFLISAFLPLSSLPPSVQCLFSSRSKCSDSNCCVCVDDEVFFLHVKPFRALQ